MTDKTQLNATEKYVKVYLSWSSMIIGSLMIITGIVVYLIHQNGGNLLINLLVGLAYVKLGRKLKLFKNVKNNIDILFITSAMFALFSSITSGLPSLLSILMVIHFGIGWLKMRKYQVVQAN